MLNKITRICKPILCSSNQRFGSSHGHGEHVKVTLDKQATWIKFNGDRRLACVEGYTDTHIPLPGLIDVDPFAHLKGRGFFDTVTFFDNEPFHHDLSHEPNSTTDQGYYIIDQPNEGRFDYVTPFFYTLGSIFLLFFLRQYSDPKTSKSHIQFVAEADEIQSVIDEKLRAKSERIKQLEAELGL